MAADYKKLYYTLFDAYDKAASLLEKSQIAEAYNLLVTTMQKAEELYLEQTDDE